MRSFQDFTNFNSTNPDALSPKAKKPMPFPLEDIDVHIADTFVKIEGILGRLNVAEKNPVNNTPARMKRIKSLKYKVKTCLKLVKELSFQCQELWF